MDKSGKLRQFSKNLPKVSNRSFGENSPKLGHTVRIGRSEQKAFRRDGFIDKFSATRLVDKKIAQYCPKSPKQEPF
jgi:hypothetical protein